MSLSNTTQWSLAETSHMLLKFINFVFADGSWVTATLGHMYITLLNKTYIQTKHVRNSYHY